MAYYYHPRQLITVCLLMKFPVVHQANLHFGYFSLLLQIQSRDCKKSSPWWISILKDISKLDNALNPCWQVKCSSTSVGKKSVFCLLRAHLYFLLLCPHLGTSPVLSWCKSVLLLCLWQMISTNWRSHGLLAILSLQKQSSDSLHWISPSVIPKLHRELQHCPQKKADFWCFSCQTGTQQGPAPTRGSCCFCHVHFQIIQQLITERAAPKKSAFKQPRCNSFRLNSFYKLYPWLGTAHESKES